MTAVVTMHARGTFEVKLARRPVTARMGLPPGKGTGVRL